MKLLKVSIFFLLSFSVSAQSIRSVYEHWLSSNAFGAFLMVQDYKETQNELVLAVRDSLDEPETLKSIATHWEYLTNTYHDRGIDPSSILLNQLQKISNRPLHLLSIKISSGYPPIFSGEIRIEEGKLLSNFDLVISKGATQDFLTTEALFPSNVFSIPSGMNQSKASVESAIYNYFIKHVKIKKNRLAKDEKRFKALFRIVDKSIVSVNLNDSLLIDLIYIPINEKITEVNIESTAYSAPGIFMAGAYQIINDPKAINKLYRMHLELMNEIELTIKR